MRGDKHVDVASSPNSYTPPTPIGNTHSPFEYITKPPLDISRVTQSSFPKRVRNDSCSHSDAPLPSSSGDKILVRSGSRFWGCSQSWRKWVRVSVGEEGTERMKVPVLLLPVFLALVCVCVLGGWHASAQSSGYDSTVALRAVYYCGLCPPSSSPPTSMSLRSLLLPSRMCSGCVL